MLNNTPIYKSLCQIIEQLNNINEKLKVPSIKYLLESQHDLQPVQPTGQTVQPEPSQASQQDQEHLHKEVADIREGPLEAEEP